MTRAKVVKARAVFATKASKARAGLKFLVYNETTRSFVFDTKAMLATEASRLECHHRLQG